jgi:predicted secreted Zn-dependent protease
MVLSMVVLVALAIGVVGGVSASPDAKKSKKKAHSTLTVLTKSRETKVVEVGPRGPTHGDMRVVNAPLYDATGTNRIGRVDLFCVLTDPADELAENAHRTECTITTTLPGGEISAQGVTSCLSSLSCRLGTYRPSPAARGRTLVWRVTYASNRAETR